MYVPSLHDYYYGEFICKCDNGDLRKSVDIVWSPSMPAEGESTRTWFSHRDGRDFLFLFLPLRGWSSAA